MSTVWQKNTTGLASHHARLLVRELSEGKGREVRIMARRRSFSAAVEAFARNDPAFAVTAEDWDPDPYLLGTPGGTVDLRTGRLRRADPADGITKLTAVAPAEQATCPLWLQFLDEATGSDASLIRFLQQWCGYALTGDTREHALVFVYGPGGNGKSVFLNIAHRHPRRLRHDGRHGHVHGIARATSTRPTSPCCAARASSRRPRPRRAAPGRRARIKQMTGGDPITARFMRQDFFTYRPQFKLTIVGNHKPVLRNVDEAARRRFNIVPFTRKPASPTRSSRRS